MPIISSFTGIAARGLGFTNGLPPLPPSSISFSSISALNAVVTFTTTPTSYPVALVQKKIMQGETLISDWATITSNSNISASNLTPANVYTVYFKTQDTGGQFSEEVTATLTTLGETHPGAPSFSIAPAAGDAGTFKLNITWTAGTIGTYSRTTQYRVETAAGVELTGWTTVSSSPIAYGADTYNGTGALTPATTYKVRLKSVAATSGTETLAAYQTQATNGIVAPNAPTDLTATRADGNAGEFSFTFSHTQGTTVRSYPVSGSQYRVRSNNAEPYTYVSGYSTFQQFSGTVTIGTSTYLNAILSPGSTYYIDTRTYDTQGTFSTVTSTSVTLKTKRDPTVGSVTVAAPTYTSTTSLSVTPSGFVAGSWPISYYQYSTNAGTNWKTLSGNTVSVLSSSTAALASDTAYTIYIRAVDTQGNVSASTSGTATTNSPDVSSAPVLSFVSTGVSERSNAYLSWTAPTYATKYAISKDGTTYGTTTSTTYTIPITAGSSHTFTVRATNKHEVNYTGHSNTKSITVGATGVPWSMTTGATSPVRYFGTTVSCDSYIGSLKIDIGSVPTSSSTAGYKYIQTIGYEVASIPSSTLAYTSVSNRRLYFLISGVTQTPPSGWEAWPGVGTIIRREVPGRGLDTNFFLDYYENGVNLGGANISNTAVSVTPDGVNWADYVTCQENVVDNINTSIRGRNLYITGYQTTGTTYA